MFKTYTTPTLVFKGAVTELTKMVTDGDGDPFIDNHAELPGALGFNL